MSDNQRVAPDRRRFMKGVAAAGGAAALAVAARQAVSAEDKAKPAHEEAPPAKGYHETTHIRAYYRSLRV